MDENLLQAIYSWNNEELKLFLKRRNIPCSSDNKAALQRQAHLAIQFNFLEKPQDICIEQSIFNKLTLENGIITLPNPSTIDTWELNSSELPKVEQQNIESYFAHVNENVKLNSLEPRALSLGKSLVLSKHCGSLLYAAVSPSVDYCFVKCFIARQTSLRNTPHEAWVVIRKRDGTVH